MAKSLDQRIKEAKDALEKAEAGSTEHATAIGRVEVLTTLKAEGYGFTQDDLNRIDRKAKEDEAKRWQDVFEMNLEEATAAKEALGTAIGGEGDADGNSGDADNGTPLERMQSALTERDEKIQAADERVTNLSRSLYSERVENNLRRALGELEVGEGEEKSRVSLRDGRFDLVRSIAGENELVEKLMKGEKLPDGVYQERAKALYKGMPEVFSSSTVGSPEGTDEASAQQRTVAGYKLKEDAESGPGIGPGIPATLPGNKTAEITEEDRRQRATSAY